METIIKSVGGLCMLVYISGILFNLTDTSNTQKAIRLTVVLYILTVVLSPVKKNNFNITSDYLFENKTVIQAQDYIISQAENKLESDIADTLLRKNISYKEVDVHINKQSESISVEFIEISGISEKDKPYVQQIIGDTGTLIFGD